MFITVQPNEHSANAQLLNSYYALRKRVFFDQLKWDVPVSGGIERDTYDDLGATYLIWCNAAKDTVYGGLRLMPTNGPTLLNDVFHATHNNNSDLKRADTWEGTRMCIDEASIRRDLPKIDSAKAFSLLFVALCETALKLGISRLVSNFEAGMSRIYRRAGLSFDTHGSAHEYGLRPVYCASFAVNHKTLDHLRARHNVTSGLLNNAPQPRASRQKATRRNEEIELLAA